MYLWIKSLELRSARHEFAGLEQLEWLLPLPEDVPHSAPATAQVQRVQLDGISDVSFNALLLTRVNSIPSVNKVHTVWRFICRQSIEGLSSLKG